MSTSGSNLIEDYIQFEKYVFDSIDSAFGITADVKKNFVLELGNGLKKQVDIAIQKGSEIFLIEIYYVSPGRFSFLSFLPDRIEKLFTYASLSYGLQQTNTKIHTIIVLNINFHANNTFREIDLNEVGGLDQEIPVFRRKRFQNELGAVISLYGIDSAESIIIDRSDLDDPKKLRDKITLSPTLNLEISPNRTAPSKKHEVFISYRRSDSAWASGRLADYLKSKFKEEEIFIDTRNIGLGENFVDAIRKQINTSNILLVVIGDSWLTVSDPESGKRRLDDIEDYVRFEISTAFRNNLIVIPLLLDGVKMPSINHLPDDISELAYRNAGYLNSNSFHADVKPIEKYLVDAGVPKKRSRRKI